MSALQLPESLRSQPLRDCPVTAAAAQRIPVGERTLIALSDGFLNLDNEQGLAFVGSPEHPHAMHDALRRSYGQPRLPLGAFLLPGETMTLVDLGLGPVDFGGMGLMVGGNLLRQLDREGVRPEDVDVIALTHLHLDHVGWLADADANLTFPNATVHVGVEDWAYFVEGDEAELPLMPHIRQALLALAEADRLVLLDADAQIAPGVTRLAAPGHTPGHSIYAIHDGADRALVFGDAMYCPQQFTATDWAAASDVDPVLARQTRERFLRDLDANGGVGVGCHFPELKASRVLTVA